MVKKWGWKYPSSHSLQIPDISLILKAIHFSLTVSGLPKIPYWSEISIFSTLDFLLKFWGELEKFLILGTSCRQNAKSHQFPVVKNRWKFFWWSFTWIATRNHLYQINLRQSGFLGHPSAGIKHTWVWRRIMIIDDIFCILGP